MPGPGTGPRSEGLRNTVIYHIISFSVCYEPEENSDDLPTTENALLCFVMLMALDF